MPDHQISAIICTHNRDSYLGAAIDSLLAQDFTAEFEVVVVDNGSSDRTREVVEQRLGDPRVKYVFEPTIGLSVARNTGARVARAEILAYLDDDAVASVSWLQVLYTAYQNHSQLAIAGGKVTLLWPPNIEPPPWLSPGLASNLGAYDLGDRMIYIQQPGLTPRGLNYSLRRSFLDEIGGFDPHLGRVGKNLLSNEELQMTEFALQRGWQVAYLPEALVAHNVAPERLKRSWFLNRGWWQGISECYREQLAGQADIGQLQRGSERFLRGLYKALKYFANPAERFDKLVYAYGQIGYLNAAIQGLLSINKKS
ncbi:MULTISPECIES: glycosyltransferase family 2 protein [unclassified Nodularia (in: cyanobacteria)]|uniref:glycosyltransferase family 2 protein n=1 Tax=unclassified Nodularia (in: cyanobacteria) TaxID=2656917 RepID=UPI00188274DE|nr:MULTISPECIES: glycosyltransferase family 2 protein [unclassified Nodularia (in: cyanobacteria)]MBE9201933.1 glycosyltransferase family 2 protein [Nodularia sp. LEGE 06071]MCC2694841.1 glycosyltransferase family 2 protein [Nodularia sp. LEGE 04288]